METINSSLNAYGKLIQSQTPKLHEFSKVKPFDYQAIFLTLKNANNEKVNPRFVNVPFKLPVLSFIEDPHEKLVDLF